MRAEKESMVGEIRRKVVDASYVILTDYRGLDVAKSDELRKRLRTVQAQMQVVPNRLFRLVAKELNAGGMEGLMGTPSAMVVGKGDVVQAAKVLKSFIQDNEKPKIKLGLLQGSVLTAADVQRLADLPAREQLLGMVVGTLAAPLRQIAGVLQQKVASVVYVLKAVEEKKAKA